MSGNVASGRRQWFYRSRAIGVIVALSFAVSVPIGEVRSTFASSQTFERFNGVSCVTPLSCVAVGTSSTGTTNFAAIWRGDGTTWTPEPLAPPVHTELLDVACPSANFCVAVGSELLAHNVPFVLHWDGQTWVRMTPTKRGIASLYAKISCPTTVFCAASGSFVSTDQITHPYVATWNGTRWRAPSIPVLSGRLNDLDCASPQMCLAVGSVEHPTVIQAPLAIQFSATTQVVSPTPLPAASSLSTVNCPDTSSCYVIGGTYVASPAGHVLLSSFARWTGTTWHPMPTPPLHANGRSSIDLDCTSANSCYLLGDMSYGAGQTVPFLSEFQLVQGGWADQPITYPGSPSSFTGSALQDMECLSGRCLVVGLNGAMTYSSIESSGVPSSPFNGQVVATANWMTVAWNHSSVSISGPVTEYRVFSNNIANSPISVPANLNRTTLPTLLGVSNLSVIVVGCNVRGCGVGGDPIGATTPSPDAPLDVSTTWDSSETARLHQSAAYLGLTVPELQVASVAALAFINGLVGPPAITPAPVPPADDQSETAITTWSATDQATLFAMARQFALTPAETQKVATQLVGYLLSLSGH